MFPIVFAAIAGRAIKIVIQWRLQRGERVRVLDLLASSTTVSGAVTAQFAVRRASVLGFAFIALWSLSPIGGQASLRLVSAGNETTTIPFRYVVPPGSLYSWQSGSDAFSRKPLLDSMFTTLLLGSADSRTTYADIWNNVKTPTIEALEANRSADGEGWYSVQSGATEYASLVGIPLSPLPDTLLSASLSIETWYWTLDCHNMSSDNIWILQQTLQQEGAVAGFTNQTWRSGTCMLYGAGTGCLYSDMGRNNYSAFDASRPRRQIYFSAEDYGVTSARTSTSAAICGIRTTYVEMQVACSGRDCRAARVRRSLSPLSTPDWTVFDCASCWTFGIPQFGFFAQAFTSSIKPGNGAARQTPVSGYIADPSAPLGGGTYPPASTLPSETYSTRVAQLLNTYWLALGGTSALASGLGDKVNGSNAGSYWDVNFNTTETKGLLIQPNAVLQCHKGWWAASVLASSVLLLICLLAPLLRMWISNPELAMNFSSLTRDNAYVAGSTLGSSLDAPDRVRLMGDRKVRLGDVRPEEEIGHMALSSVDANAVAGRVLKRRHYC